MFETMRKMAAASAPPAAAPAAVPAAVPSDPLALGRLVFEKTAGGVGCQYCHGMDGRGNQTMGGPSIRDETEARVRGALRDVALMSKIQLNDAEIAAVVAYLQVLGKQP
jgi:mono/diheme cytochrome c family protein